MKFATRAIHSGEEPDCRNGFGDVVSPIHMSTTYASTEPGRATRGYDYTRTANPTRTALETKLASLEGAKHGLAFASGLAAETTLFLSLLKRGDNVLAAEDLYGGTRRLLVNVLSGFGISTTFADFTDPDALRSKFRKKTALLWMESPSNPLMKVSDIRLISEIAHEHGAISVVDNTFMSPFLQHPLKLGADIVLHSTTKYIAGHSDVLGGAVMLSDDALFERIHFNQNAAGAVPSPFDSFLVMRGAKTLHLRMQRHCENAAELASFLEERKEISHVLYPGLESHPQHRLASRQADGFGGMLSFEISGSEADARKFVRRLKLFALAESLGGVESLIEIPALMTHASVPESERRRLGINGRLIRLSAGIEDIDDLKGDLLQALKGM
ncbi:MAG: aminotransferase class I/II-fold pyridoxal phosphate-dependent enzyme [Candidatus Thermoplasmatota archaeon]|nr:aminotransferase class I/II-fold pyridoxal phosphate-dependent enzyme [Candidatus Thermoplasmatota archaeon]